MLGVYIYDNKYIEITYKMDDDELFLYIIPS